MNGYHYFHGSEAECEADEAAAGSGISSASSIDSEELLDDASDAVEAVKVLLQGLGEDLHRPGLVKTPLRVARAFAFATKGCRQAVKDVINDALFPEAGVTLGSGFAGGLGGMVVVRSIDQYSLCGSCLLPFKVCCHIAYVSSGYKIVGLSKLARVADMFARRLQNPQTLANQICQGLADTIKPTGVAVVLQSWHLPLPRYYHDIDLPKDVFQHATITLAGEGKFEDRSSDVWAYFLALLRLEGISIPNEGLFDCMSSAKKVWCPCANFNMRDVEDESHSTVELSRCNGHSMRTNGSLKHSIGRKEWCPSANFDMGDAVEECHSTVGLSHCNGHSMHINGSLKHSIGMNGRSNDSHHISCVPSKEKFSAMVDAVEALLEAFVGGFVKDLHSPAKCYVQWLLLFKRGYQQFKDNGIMNGNGVSLPRTLPNDEQSRSFQVFGVATQLDAPFYSLCEHHLLPFFGKAHIGYLWSEVGSKDVDRNVVLDIIKDLGQKLQVQERLAREIAEALACRFSLASIIVVLEASHVCLVSRGVEKLGSNTVTDAVLGQFAMNCAAKIDFLGKVLHSRKIEQTPP